MLTSDQSEGIEFLAARRVAMLADKVGFGKSAQFVAAADMIGAQRITVLCPPILRVNEAAEFARWSWAGHRATIIRSGKDTVPRDGLVICSYKLAAENKAVHRALVNRRADVLILDEAHAVKSPGSKRTKALFSAHGIASTAGRVWFVTGTPTPNNAAEYYVFAKCAGVWPGTYNQFVERYCNCVDTPFGPRIMGTRNEDELKAMLRPFVLAREKVDPERAPLTIDEIAVEGDRPDFSGIPAEALEAIEAAIAADDWRTLDGPAVATVRRHIGIAKAKAVADLAACELDGGVAKMLIFCEHTAVIDTIAEKLGDAAAVIDGRTPQRLRESLLAGFQFGPTPRVLICQRVALKEGVTLTAATRVLLAEPPWTPDDCSQMIARAWRRGQSKHVRASYVYLHGSFDARVAATLSRKSADIAKISLFSSR